MSEALKVPDTLTDGIAALRDHLPSRDDVDVSAITDRISGHKPGKSGKRGLLAILLGLVAAGGAFAAARRKRAAAAVSPNIYTPPLPKP
jgi:hypothetical protein